VTFRRYFHLPTGLEPGDHVLLVMRHAGPFRSVKLNGTALRFVEQPGGSVRADLTGMLAPRNELTIDLEPPSPAPPHMREAILEVALEIHPA
jgi:hypothetical protein